VWKFIDVDELPDRVRDEGCLSHLDSSTRIAIRDHIRRAVISCSIADAVLRTLWVLHSFTPSADNLQVEIHGTTYFLAPHMIAFLAPGDLVYGEVLDVYIHATLARDFDKSSLSFLGFSAT
jgi:hypothetical protein